MTCLMMRGILFMLFLWPVAVHGCLKDDSSSWYDCVTPAMCRDKGNVIFKTYCLQECPKYVHYFNSASRTCFAECPQESVLNGSSCQSPSVCTSRNQVVFNRTCADSCPQQSPYVVGGVCHNRCPNTTVRTGFQCIDDSTCLHAGRVIFNRTCVEKCPTETPYVMYGTCKYSCTNGTVVHRSSCIRPHDCYALVKVTYNGSCLNQCPTTAPLNFTGTCVHDCPQSHVQNEMTCISEPECKSKGKYIAGDKCLSECPKQSPYFYEAYKTCYAKCPDFSVRRGLLCIDSQACTSVTEYYAYIYNGTCLDKCPSEAPIVHERKCLSTCPGDTVYKDGDCVYVQDCIQAHTRYVYSGKCVSTCPPQATYMKDNTCFESCPGTTVASNLSCITKRDCNQAGKVVLNMTCVDGCPEDKPFDLEGECSRQCQKQSADCASQICDLLVVNNSKCITISDCTTGGRFVFNKECVSKCPQGTVQDKEGYERGICVDLTLDWIMFSMLLLVLMVTLCLLCLMLTPRKPPTDFLREVVKFQEGDNIDDIEAMPDNDPLGDINEVDEARVVNDDAGVIVHNPEPHFDDDVPLVQVSDETMSLENVIECDDDDIPLLPV